MNVSHNRDGVVNGDDIGFVLFVSVMCTYDPGGHIYHLLELVLADPTLPFEMVPQQFPVDFIAREE